MLTWVQREGLHMGALQVFRKLLRKQNVGELGLPCRREQSLLAFMSCIRPWHFLECKPADAISSEPVCILPERGHGGPYHHDNGDHKGQLTVSAPGAVSPISVVQVLQVYGAHLMGP